MTRPTTIETEATGIVKPASRLARWQVSLAAISVIIAIGGGALWAYAALTAPEAAEPIAASRHGNVSPFATGFAPHDADHDPPQAEASQIDRLIDRYGGAVFRLGFGFFAGFALGYLLRAFVKVTLLVSGAILLGLFALQYFSVITVDWQRISGGFDTLSAWLGEQTKGFLNFVTGVLPSAAAGFAGAFVGFIRR